MVPHGPDPSNMKFSAPSSGDALQMTWGYIDFPNSTRLLYCQSQTCWMILVPFPLGISDVANTGTFAPPRFICVEMPEILVFSHFAETG